MTTAISENEILSTLLPSDDPFENFRRWMAEAEATKALEPTAMTLATVSKDGWPSARIVLYKGLGSSMNSQSQGFRLFTNYESRKSEDLAATGKAALVFFWPSLTKQIRIEGRVERLDDASSDQYFQSRARGSRIGAWASPQSQKIRDRAELIALVQKIEDRFKDQEVPRPPNWGGWLLVPERMEFWKAGDSRLHDRFVFERTSEGWKRSRLAP